MALTFESSQKVNPPLATPHWVFSGVAESSNSLLHYSISPAFPFREGETSMQIHHTHQTEGGD
jgi:hypothetical protein